MKSEWLWECSGLGCLSWLSLGLFLWALGSDPGSTDFFFPSPRIHSFFFSLPFGFHVSFCPLLYHDSRMLPWFRLLLYLWLLIFSLCPHKPPPDLSISHWASSHLCLPYSFLGGGQPSAWRRWAGSSVGNAIENYHIVASLDTILVTSPMLSHLILTSHLPAGHHLIELWWFHNCPSEERVLWCKSPVKLLMVPLTFLIFVSPSTLFSPYPTSFPFNNTDIFPRSQSSSFIHLHSKSPKMENGYLKKIAFQLAFESWTGFQ